MLTRCHAQLPKSWADNGSSRVDQIFDLIATPSMDAEVAEGEEEKGDAGNAKGDKATTEGEPEVEPERTVNAFGIPLNWSSEELAKKPKGDAILEKFDAVFLEKDHHTLANWQATLN